MRTHGRAPVVMLQAANGRALRLASMLVAGAVLGEAGHLVLDQVNAVVAHHFFHIVFPLAAFVAFAGFVALDIRAHGWPRFSLRLDPTASASRPSSRPPA